MWLLSHGIIKSSNWKPPWMNSGMNIVSRVPWPWSQLSFFKIWPFSAEFHITYTHILFKNILPKIVPRHKWQTDPIHNLYTSRLQGKLKGGFREVKYAYKISFVLFLSKAQFWLHHFLLANQCKATGWLISVVFRLWYNSY